MRNGSCTGVFSLYVLPRTRPTTSAVYVLSSVLVGRRIVKEIAVIERDRECFNELRQTPDFTGEIGISETLSASSRCRIGLRKGRITSKLITAPSGDRSRCLLLEPCHLNGQEIGLHAPSMPNVPGSATAASSAGQQPGSGHAGRLRNDIARRWRVRRSAMRKAGGTENASATIADKLLRG